MRKAVVLFALMCSTACVFAREIRWDYDDLKAVSDYLVSQCQESKRLADFTAQKGYVPKVILGEIKTKGEDIDTSMLVKQLQDALINSGVVDFVSDPSERLALRDEKADQDTHADVGSAKAIDRESAADFMLQGELYFIAQVKNTFIYSVFVQFHDIEQNTIMFSKEFSVTASRGSARRKKGQTRYHSLSLAIPIVNRSFDADGADCSFDATSMGVDYSLYNIKNENKLTVLAKAGVVLGGGELGAKYKNNSKITLDDITDFGIYGRVGLGRAFATGGGTVVFLPTGGVGAYFDYLTAEYESSVYSSTKDFTGYNATIDLFINTFLAVVPNDSWGISFSLEIAMNTWGAGSFTELGDYNTDAGKFSFIPAFGVCRKF